MMEKSILRQFLSYTEIVVYQALAIRWRVMRRSANVANTIVVHKLVEFLTSKGRAIVCYQLFWKDERCEASLIFSMVIADV